jgi:predicted nuclease of predicted toxin-antitoxin system
MLIKLDENLPAVLVDVLAQFGHDADTTPDEGLRGHEDQDIWEAVKRAGRFLITQDLDFSDVRAFAPGTHPGLLLVRLDHPSRAALIERLYRILQTEDIESWRSCLVVVTEKKIRVRRP